MRGAEGCLFIACFAGATFVCEVERAAVLIELEEEELCTRGVTLDPEEVPMALGELLVGVVEVATVTEEECVSEVADPLEDTTRSVSDVEN